MPSKKTKKQLAALAPLARVQAAAPLKEEQAADHNNLWWGESSASKRRRRDTEKETPAAHRCSLARDSGRTMGGPDICLFFAQGCCHLGHRCSRLHRLPNHSDSFPNELDCFGRSRDADDDGAGRRRVFDEGTGNAAKIANRTLWIGLVETDRESLRRDFSEFGEVLSVRRVGGKMCAFVEFDLRYSAEFAKEAMAHQTLGGGHTDGDLHPSGAPTLHRVRWASEDPAPSAQGKQVLDVARVLAESTAVIESPAAVSITDGDAYPDTNAQYDAYPDDTNATEEPLPAGWASAIDPNSGATYYCHLQTGSVTWQRPTHSDIFANLNGLKHFEKKDPVVPPGALPGLAAYESGSDDESA